MKEETLAISIGALESPFDKRTVQASMLDQAATLTENGKVDLDKPSTSDLCNQRKIGACVLCTSRMMAEAAFNDGVRLSEYWSYLMSKVLIEENLYEGSALFYGLKTGNKYGFPTKAMEAYYPLKVDGTYQEFINDFRAKYGGKIPQEVLDNATLHKIPGYYSVGVDPVAIAKAIQAGKVVGARLAVGENTYTAADGRVSWAEADLLDLRAPKNIEGGHAMAINEHRGLTWMNQWLAGPNSWSRAWGRNGYFSFTMKTQRPFFTEAWAIADIPAKIIEDLKKDDFKKDLKEGMTDPDVKRLQQYLNSKGFTVAATGAGSKGKETTYFGQATKAALIRFQKAKAITPAIGFFGPVTRAFVNSQ